MLMKRLSFEQTLLSASNGYDFCHFGCGVFEGALKYAYFNTQIWILNQNDRQLI